MTPDQINKALTELSQKRTEKEYSWFKHAISVVSILLGLLITLNDNNDIYFKITVSIFGLNVLSGLVFLYDEVLTPHNLIRNINKKQNVYDWSNGTKTVVADRNKISVIARIVFFWTLFLSVVSLVLFAWNK